ncbi:hypothetical protein [Asticcacaulis sp.]|uniref:hypothetical protein n=1 Tax=Asticcacaulis sp. TaxID=1872648 RepID=UPI00261CE3B8|nr:hypothetical protein [Asticcacaulis sp.]
MIPTEWIKPQTQPQTVAESKTPTAKQIAQKELDDCVEEFFKIYEEFVLNLVRTFGNESQVDDPLNKAMVNNGVISTAVDRDERIVKLATRWHLMVEQNKEAFATKNDAFFLSHLEGLSVFTDLGIAQVLKSERFFVNRDIFWAYVNKVSKKAKKVVDKSAMPLPSDASEFERDAQMAQTLEQMGLLAKHSVTGEITVDIKRLLDPKNAKAIMKRVMGAQKGHDPAVMKTALDAVTSMMSGSEEGEKAFESLLPK